MTNESEGTLQRERDIGRLEGRVTALEGWMENFEKATKDDLREIGGTIKQMAAKVDEIAHNFARSKGQFEGGVWTFVKIVGGMIVVAASLMHLIHP